MANKHLRKHAHEVHPEMWWYEEPHGLSIVVCPRAEDGTLVRTRAYTIRWNSLRAALKRKDLKEA